MSNLSTVPELFERESCFSILGIAFFIRIHFLLLILL
jgi:hypothetical protein